MTTEIQTAGEKDVSGQDQCVEDSLTPKKRSYAQMMASSPNSQEAHHSAEVSNKEATPDSEGSKSHLKRLKVMEPLASKDENAEKAEEFVEPSEENSQSLNSYLAAKMKSLNDKNEQENDS